MGEEEKRNLGILLVVMNLGIIFAGIAALFASTSYGKKCFVKYIGVKSKHQEKILQTNILARPDGGLIVVLRHFHKTRFWY